MDAVHVDEFDALGEDSLVPGGYAVLTTEDEAE